MIAPTLTYHYYPAFAEYPGSTTLRLETARDLTIDVVRSLATHGPRLFYALNTGVSTVRALRPAAEELAKDGILLKYTDVLAVLGPVEKEIAEQEGGTHADEIETSIMLVLAPGPRRHEQGVKDYTPGGKGKLDARSEGGRHVLADGDVGRSDAREP